jgi:tRNA A37 threonylcarbamoyladenosine synthetase subunit TsaC/SUA5/YrdC
MPEILKVSNENSEQMVLTRAAEIVAGGGIIAYPTETFYGLGAALPMKKQSKRFLPLKAEILKTPFP